MLSEAIESTRREDDSHDVGDSDKLIKETASSAFHGNVVVYIDMCFTNLHITGTLP